ncbi:hypothetical protein JN06_00883 [Bacteroides zoogleoformans]|nr:hypothetical protein [Bacteroides zoogleoformans]TWJ17289.1 hypothetical protein JN06_00883 [Bacteroides zoogleoformans]
MQTFIQNSVDAWIILGSTVFVIIVAFGHNVYHKLSLLNKKHHFIVWNDNSIDSIYAWDDEDEL